jgi:hypothetical protein
MSADPNKKSPRTFQCRDVLWETFEQMARELECSVDYLINEAMKQYAKQRSYGNANATQQPPPRGTPYPSPGRGVEPPPLAPPSGQNMYASAPGPSQPPMGRPPTGAGLAPPPGGRLPPPPARPGSLPAPPPPPRQGAQTFGPASNRTAQLSPPLGPPGRSVPPAPRSQPPPIPRGATPMPPIPTSPTNGGFGAHPGSGSAQLSIIYQGERMAVTKDRFVIGRGKQSSDLTLKDPNVSRQHAMIEYQNGVYFMVDMGSTNGVEYNGQRIARKQIAEGDVFRICDHDLRFTYR